MKTIELINKYEGCVLKKLNSSEVWKIGYGHTNGVKNGMRITKDQTLNLLKQD